MPPDDRQAAPARDELSSLRARARIAQAAGDPQVLASLTWQAQQLLASTRPRDRRPPRPAGSQPMSADQPHVRLAPGPQRVAAAIDAAADAVATGAIDVPTDTPSHAVVVAVATVLLRLDSGLSRDEAQTAVLAEIGWRASAHTYRLLRDEPAATALSDWIWTRARTLVEE